MSEPNWELFGKLDQSGYAIHPPVNDPPTYNVNRNLTWLTANGYEQHDEQWWTEHQPPAPQPTPRTRCTKYQLITCLRTYYTTLLQQLKSAYTANIELQFYWNSVLNLDRNNTDFKSACTLLGITDQQLDDIFSKIEGEQPTTA